MHYARRTTSRHASSSSCSSSSLSLDSCSSIADYTVVHTRLLCEQPLFSARSGALATDYRTTYLVLSPTRPGAAAVNS